MNKAVMFSSATCEWETPAEFFKTLDDRFHFTTDVCATAENAKCSNYFTAAQNGLTQAWEGVCWCNPPYGRGIDAWVKKAAESNATTVMLLPARTDTAWFHDYIYGRAEIQFIRGRLKFGGCKNNAPFPSMVCIFRNREEP